MCSRAIIDSRDDFMLLGHMEQPASQQPGHVAAVQSSAINRVYLEQSIAFAITFPSKHAWHDPSLITRYGRRMTSVLSIALRTLVRSRPAQPLVRSIASSMAAEQYKTHIPGLPSCMHACTGRRQC